MSLTANIEVIGVRSNHTIEQHIASTNEALECQRRARSIVRARINRQSFFETSLFSEPAWDILLELFVAYVDQTRIQVSAIGLDSGIPPTTTIRWIRALFERGFIERMDDQFDGRRCFISLSDEGASLMIKYLRSLPS